MNLPPAPRYGTASLAEVLPDAVAALRGQRTAALPLPTGLAGIVVLVIDGMGRRNLDDHADLAPFLAAATGLTLDAPFPTTTATSLTTIGTGLGPGEHGVTGYSLALPGSDRRLVTLTWTWDQQDRGPDARDDIVPEDFQSAPTVFERAWQLGLEAVTVLRPEFVTSGLTRAGLRGGKVITSVDLDNSLVAAVEAARVGGPTVVYAHHGDLDTLGHVSGPGTDAWCGELARIDACLARAATDLPSNVAIVVTADHGMTGASPEGFVELADHPELLDGVRVLTGDSRARQLHTREDAAPDVLAAWQEHAGDRAHVVSRDTAIDAGWFGLSVTAEARATIGDVVVSSAVSDAAWVHRHLDLFGGRLAGLHGALTPTEVEVPALILTR